MLDSQGETRKSAKRSSSVCRFFCNHTLPIVQERDNSNDPRGGLVAGVRLRSQRQPSNKPSPPFDNNRNREKYGSRAYQRWSANQSCEELSNDYWHRNS